MPDSEPHPFWGGELCTENEVTLVLASLVIDHDDGSTKTQVLQRFLDGANTHDDAPSIANSRRRRTWRARTSVSTFIRLPTSAAPSVVATKVSGMRETSAQSRPTAETVRETPSRVMDPLCATSGAMSSLREKRMTLHWSPGRTSRTSATAST